jgi:hypothetical protein
MNTITLDKNALNGLFDNQKKLDDLFDSIFDDNNYFISSAPASTQSNTGHSDFKDESQFIYSGCKVMESLDAIKHNSFFYVLPIALEMAVIYLLMTQLL